MRINNNIPALTAFSSLARKEFEHAKSTLRLSSGTKINSAADDAAGLSIANKLRNQQKGTYRASLNASNGISVVQTADSALNEIHASLQRVREIAVRVANGTYNDDDREKAQMEVSELLKEVDAMSKKCNYNKQNLLNGGDKSNEAINPNANPNNPPLVNDLTLKIHIGANKDMYMLIDIPSVNMDCLPEANLDWGEGLRDLDVSTVEPEDIFDSNNNLIAKASGASKAIEIADACIARISDVRAKIGAYQNRFEASVVNLDSAHEDISKALSRIYDTDMAQEMTDYTSTNIIMQAATSVLAQANQRPQMVLQLLQ